jgi:hypothetical protein
MTLIKVELSVNILIIMDSPCSVLENSASQLLPAAQTGSDLSADKYRIMSTCAFKVVKPSS